MDETGILVKWRMIKIILCFSQKKEIGRRGNVNFQKSFDKNIDDDGVVFTSWILPFWLQQL
jgi:hypothetical protein